MASSISIRMYNQQSLGDCFLLKFKSGRKYSYMLIDFGSYFSGNHQREIEIAEDILNTIKQNPLTIVLTHQHKDHLSGFITAKSIFDQMNIEEVWFSYLDDPDSEVAQQMRDATEKFWKLNQKNKQLVNEKFGEVDAVSEMLRAKEKFDLFAEDQSGGLAIKNLLEWCNFNCRFLKPGENFDIQGLSAGSIKAYVLGPPTDPALLRKLNPNMGDEVHGLINLFQLNNLEASGELLNQALEKSVSSKSADDQFADFPFSKKYRYKKDDKDRVLWLQKKYDDEEQGWRKIDHNWLGELGRLSLHMDTLTNNSSLVLAFELVQENKVALFAGDAQIGNWKSWFDVIFTNSEKNAHHLLTRTVFYKAGHHSSHNATLLKALDLMNENELVVMIPVNQEISDKMGFAMLRPGMLTGYNRKSRGKVIRNDKIFQQQDSSTIYPHPFAEHLNDFTPVLKRKKDKSGKDHLYLEYTVA